MRRGGSASYGPFHNSANQPGGAHPSAGPSASNANPAEANPPYGGTPASPASPAYGSPPTSGSSPAYGPPPTSATNPTYGPPPSSGANPTYGGTPTSGAGPVYGEIPTSGAGPVYGGAPTSGAGPSSGPPHWSATDPVSGSAVADPYGFSVLPSYAPGPRIEPTPKQPKGRFILPALAGLLAGLVIFGTGGWFLGRSTGGGGADPVPTSARSAPAAATLPPYEQNQVAINQPKFTGPLAPVAQGWLAQLSGCSRSGEAGGPVPNKGEKARVRCEMDAMSVIFVEYVTIADRDKARVKTLGQNVDARTLTPGAAAGGERAAPSGRTNGNYVEYAYQASGKTVSGIWWDDSATPVAAYLLAFWKEGVGQKWEPMRDVWARYA